MRQPDQANEAFEHDSIGVSIFKSQETIDRLNAWNNVKKYTLVDSQLQMSFVLDSQRINISAYDFEDRLVWRADPWKDKGLRAVYVRRPLIVEFFFFSEDPENIQIKYNSKQVGTVNRPTGKFDYLGSD